MLSLPGVPVMVAVSPTQVAGGATVANAAGVIAVGAIVVAKVKAKVIVNANIISFVFCFFLRVPIHESSSLLLRVIIFYNLHAYFKAFLHPLFSSRKYFFALLRSNYQKFMYKRYHDLR